MKRKITVLVALIAGFGLIAPAASAQDAWGGSQGLKHGSRSSVGGYTDAISINLGGDMGVAWKRFVAPRGAIETQLGYNINRDGVMLSSVYQYHVPLAEGFNLYVGGGLNIGALHLGKHRDAEFAFGIDPTVGFEYKIPGAPVALAIDYKPNINFTTDSQWELAAFKIRFTL